MSIARPIAWMFATLLVGACSASPPSVAPQTEVPMASSPFTLTSSAFTEGGAIPREFSCDGQDASPPLTWTGVPDGARTLALVVDDPDASDFVHWVLYNVDASASGELARGVSASPDAPSQGRNGFGRVGYGGPCPPSGVHHYVFRMLALDSELALGGSPSASDVLRAADGHILAEARLTATFARAR